MLNKKIYTLGAIFFFLLQKSFAVTDPSTPWQPAENMISQKATITNIISFHHHVYAIGYNPFIMSLCPFVYSYNNFYDWTLVNNGMQHPTYACYPSYNVFVVYQDQLYAGGQGSFYVYNGDDTNPKWTSLGEKGMLTQNDDILDFAVVNNKLYALTGSMLPVPPHTSRKVIYVYSPKNQSWQAIGTLQSNNIANATMISYHNKLYLSVNYNSANGLQYTPVISVYNGNDATPNWTPVFTDPTDRIIGPMEVSNDTLFIGGNISTTDCPNCHNQAYVLAYNGNDTAPQWTDVTNGLPIKSSASSHATNIYAFGTFGNSLYASGYNTEGRPFIYQFNADINHPNWSESDNGLTQIPNSAQIFGFAQLEGLQFMLDTESEGTDINPNVYARVMDSNLYAQYS